MTVPHIIRGDALWVLGIHPVNSVFAMEAQVGITVGDVGQSMLTSPGNAKYLRAIWVLRVDHVKHVQKKVEGGHTSAINVGNSTLTARGRALGANLRVYVCNCVKKLYKFI